MPTDNRTDLEILEDDLLHMMRVRNEALALAAAHVAPNNPTRRRVLIRSWLNEARDRVDRESELHAAVTEQP